MVATAKLLDARPDGTVFTAGDNAYFHGTDAEYRDCYHPYWGRHKGRTRPAPGNHEYETAGASGYYNYFGDVARGPEGQGYYSYMAGPWKIIVLNSDLPGGVGQNSPQLRWLRTELTSDPKPCTLAIWHRPLFTSGPNGPQRDMIDFWKVLYELNVDVVVNGHDHLYERFTAQDPDGRADAARGIRQFTVGTGGGSLYPAAGANSNSRIVISAFGVLQFTLTDGRYAWQFIPADPTGSTDSGSEGCH